MMVKLNECIFLIEEDELLGKYDTIWDKISADIKKEFENELVYNNFFFLKTNWKSYGDEATDFDDKEVFKVESNHVCLAIISLDSSLNKDGNYYPQVF